MPPPLSLPLGNICKPHPTRPSASAPAPRGGGSAWRYPHGPLHRACSSLRLFSLPHSEDLRSSHAPVLTNRRASECRTPRQPPAPNGAHAPAPKTLRVFSSSGPSDHRTLRPVATHTCRRSTPGLSIPRARLEPGIIPAIQRSPLDENPSIFLEAETTTDP